MRGLLIFLPVASCFFAGMAYAFGGNAGVILAGFIIAGPLVVVLLGLLMGRRADDRQKAHKREERD